MAPLDLALKCRHGHSDFGSHKGAWLGHVLLLNANRKSYMGSQMLLSDLALIDLERSR